MLFNNPLSARSHHRNAMSLAEVLVSMGIMTIGLLGVAALFPVGGRYMQSGDIADNANAIAQAALDDAIIRGHLDPENWIAIDVDAATGLQNSMGSSGPNACEPFSLVDSLRESYERTSLNLERDEFADKVHGTAFVIDPLGFASTLEEPGNSRVWQAVQGSMSSRAVRRFPASDELTNSPAWESWALFGSTWPVRRVTTMIGSGSLNTSNFHYQLPKARQAFASTDDLAQSLPVDGDSPARQRLDTYQDNNGNPVAARRQSQGNYSWIISVSPGSSEARDALATQPDAYQYDVSVVVFYKRVIGQGFEGALEAERLVTAKVVTTGIAGGELLLERRSQDSVEESPFENLREGEYLMLTGPHPLSTNNRPMLFMQWYKVQTIEDSGEHSINGTRVPLDRENTVLVSLRGPDWPWEPGTNLSNDLRVGIIPGAVAVHTKTMRLESGSDWGL